MDKLQISLSVASWHRPAFTLIEVAIAAAILAIGSAVILPRWSESVERTRINNMRRCVETNVAMLRRLSVRTGQEFNLAFTANTAQMTIVPAVPQVLGDATGVVDYADRFPGISFTAIDLNGNNTLNVNLYGELVSVSTGQSLNAGIVTIANNTASQTIDLLAAQGLASIPTQQEPNKADSVEVSVAGIDASIAGADASIVGADVSIAGADVSVSTSKSLSTQSTNSGKKSFLEKLLGL